MDKKTATISALIAIIAAGAGFWGGTKYESNKMQNQVAQSRNVDGQAGFGSFRGQRGGQGQNGTQERQGEFVGGEIISKDDKSITVKDRSGNSKIVFFSDSTSIDKSVSGELADLSAGKQVTANGKSNPDGSITAQNIQLRPMQPAK